MLSILIPTYNYNAFPLAQSLEKQALQLDITYEIICRDDGSFAECNVKNQEINWLTHAKFIEGKSNLGSVGNRITLIHEAQYHWLLILDADTKVSSKDFIKNYIPYITTDFEVILGGIGYQNEIPPANQSLRYYFGKSREEVPADTRNERPYKHIVSSNMLIKKETALKTIGKIKANTYGLDYIISGLMKQRNAKVLHIDNAVYHLGLDTNEIYLSKIESAIQTLNERYQKKQLPKHDISLLKAYQKMRMLGLHHIVKIVFNTVKNPIKNHLLHHPKPQLKILMFYKLGYLCSLN